MKQEGRNNEPSIEAKRLMQIGYIMDHWDELPEKLQGKFEGIMSTTEDFLNKNQKTS